MDDSSIKDIKENLKQLDSKFDSMHEVLIRNTVVLEQHEKRSTASENRLEIVEDSLYDLRSKFYKIQGFFFYSSVAITGLGGLVAIIYHTIPVLQNIFGHK